MGRGWRKAFCNTIPTTHLDSEPLSNNINSLPSPNASAKLGFFSSLGISNPSTPRLRVRTSTRTSTSTSIPDPSLSNPCSPRSPFAILKNTLRISKSVCPLCLHTLNPSQTTPIYTAHCSHAFHFPCIASHVRTHSSLICPVCNVPWKDVPLLAFHKDSQDLHTATAPASYKDDEPLPSPRFNPVAEEGVQEFQGFCITPTRSAKYPVASPKNVDVKLLPEAALVSRSRYYETYALALRVKAPSTLAKHRAPIDLVTVLDLSGSMAGYKLQMLKRAMRLVISSLCSADRLSIVVFASAPQRLLPLRRMTAQGQKAARKIIDQLACDRGSSVDEALRKAAKVLEDRRDKNPVCSIILLSDSGRNNNKSNLDEQRESSSARFAHIEFGAGEGQQQDAFTKCVGGLLSVVVQDLRVQLGFQSSSAPAEIMAVYSCNGRPSLMSSDSARLGDMYAEEEREVLVELRVATSAIGAHHVMCVRSSYKDPVTGEVMYGRERAILVPRPQCGPRVERLRNLFIYTRAVAESRRLVEHGEYDSAHHLITSATSLVVQSEYARELEAELAHVHWRKEKEENENGQAMSAWRAAEKLAKVAIINKSVGDLHGFENARF